MISLTIACESFMKFESEALRNRRMFGDHDPRRSSGDFFSPHSTGVADPRRINLGESVNLTFAAMIATLKKYQVYEERCEFRASSEQLRPNSGVNRYLCQHEG